MRSAWSKDDGAYRVRLPAGDYRVLYYGKGGPQKNARIVGTLSVESFETRVYDVVIFENRSLRGRYSLSLPPEYEASDERGETVLDLELRRFLVFGHVQGDLEHLVGGIADQVQHAIGKDDMAVATTGSKSATGCGVELVVFTEAR